MTVSLVTGGAGFIGSHVARKLISRGDRVIVLDDLSGGFMENLHPEGIFVKGSITDNKLVEKIFNEHQIDYIYHFAAYAAENLSHFIKRYNYMNNVIGSVNLINASVRHKVKCFVFTSSIAVYGEGNPPFHEDMIPCPVDSYGIAKYTIEQELKITHDLFGLDYIIFRPHNVFGEYQNIWDKYRNVIGIFMNQILQKEPLTVFGDGKQVRAFSYIGNFSSHIANSVFVKEANLQIINIGADEEITVNHLARKVMEAMGETGQLVHLPARHEVKMAYCDHTKERRFFSGSAHISLDEGLRKMAEWARKAGGKPSSPFAAIEINEKLPVSWKQS